MRQRRGGFTLLEVIIALAIFAMVAVPLLNLELAATAQTARVNLARRAGQLAASRLDQLLLDEFRGDVTREEDAFSVRTRTEDMELNPGLERVVVTVSYEGEVAAELAAFRVQAAP
ncbi:MAG: type II secretion system protein [Armatimonadetes bacterium]|nr:type II secretion system protein [Armatimonadota bacterium]